MKLAVFSTLLLSALVSGAPAFTNKGFFFRDFVPGEFQIYESKHDIVKIVAPQNELNSNVQKDVSTIFFVEADEKDGQRVDQGLYIMKQGNTKKLLDNVRDITAPRQESKTAYFAAKDGIYIYNDEKNTAEKYGTVNDDLIGITSYCSCGCLYVLTANKEVFIVTDKGTNKIKIDDVKNAEQIVSDYANNLFFADSKDMYVFNDNGVKKISLPENHSKITLLRPPFTVVEGIYVLVDKLVYKALPDGTSEITSIHVDPQVTAISVEPEKVQYYGYNKKIYRFDLDDLIVAEFIREMQDIDLKDTRIY